MNYLTFEQLRTELKNRANFQDLATKQIFVQQGEIANSINFVLSGQIRLVTFTEERIINHYFVMSGESFTETALFADTYLYTAIADKPSRIASIDKEVFRQGIIDLPELADAYIRQLATRLRAVKTLLELRSLRSARERILQYLIYQVKSSNPTIILERSLKDLAFELGLSAEALSRTLSRLEFEGVISRRQRSITLNEDLLNINNN